MSAAMSTIKGGKRHSETDQKDLQEIHDVLMRHDVQCDPANPYQKAKIENEDRGKSEEESREIGEKTPEEITSEKAKVLHTKCNEVNAIVPLDVTSFSALVNLTTAHEIAERTTQLNSQFTQLVNNILNNPTVLDKPAALAALTNEYTQLVQDTLKSKSLSLWKRAKALLLKPKADYPWDQCIADQMERYGDEETAKKVCGMIRARYGHKALTLTENEYRAIEKELGIKPGNQYSFLKSVDDGIYEDTDTKDKGKIAPPALFLWKESSDRLRFFAVYSNNYRDNDHPPEIISAASHETFVKEVDAGHYPPPELWHWHIPGTRYGIADWVGFDPDTGFALASGLIDSGHEKEAEAVVASGALLSHGMLEHSITRDPVDFTIITHHQTLEISDLPPAWAANSLTGFELLKPSGNKETDMAIPAHKRDYLKQVGLTDERIAAIDAALEGKARQAQAASLEHKEIDMEKENKSVSTSTPTQATATATVVPVTAESLADALAAILKPLNEAVTVLGARLKTLEERDATATAEAKEIADVTPPASLAALLMQRMTASASPATVVDGRTTLAKSGPNETPAPSASPTGISFLDRLATLNAQSHTGQRQ